jgi:rhamnulokinase
LKGLRIAAEQTQRRIDSVGIDGWGVDYVLLDRVGNRVGRAYCYRDPRSLPQMDRAFTILPRRRIYEITGIQFMPLNTLYQILAHVAEYPEEWERTHQWLNVHEYFQFRMSGVAVSEYTNASTTQMLEVFSRTWSRELAEAFKLSLDKFSPIVQAGTILSDLRREIAEEVGLANVKVIAPACHDTGAAVAGIPFAHNKLAYISSGTWSLVGTLVRTPIVSAEAYDQNFTNEGGVANTIRFLKNVTGMWLLQECLREWNAQGLELTAAKLAQQTAGIAKDGPFFVVDDKRFLAPGNMVGRIQAALEEQGFAEETRMPFDRLCIVGGGVRNETLNRLTGQWTGLEIVRGPSESTAGGNVAVQLAALENTHSVEQIQEIASRLTY